MARFSRIQATKLFLGRAGTAGSKSPVEITATAKEINDLVDPDINNALMAPGTGISTATNAIVKYGIHKIGGIITTQILIDLTGLCSSANANDIIGKDAQANCHFGQITTAINGVIWGGNLKCLETPAGGDDDINVYYALAGTGTEDAALSDGHEMLNGGDAVGNAIAQPLTAFPEADEYLYLLHVQTDANAAYSAGRFLLTLYGYVE
jgi:hypothetical protein